MLLQCTISVEKEKKRTIDTKRERLHTINAIIAKLRTKDIGIFLFCERPKRL